MFVQLNLGKKIGSGFGICLVLLLVASSVAYFGLKKADSGFVTYRTLARESNLTGRLQANLLAMRMDVKNYLISNEQQFLDSYDKRHTLLNSLLSDAKQSVTDPTRLSHIRKTEQQLQAYEEYFSEVVKYYEQRNTLVKERLDVNGLNMRKAVTNIIVSAFEDNDAVASFYASQVQESLLLGRLYSNKYLKTNSESDYEFASDFLNTNLKVAASSLDEQLQNPARRELFANFQEAAKIYTETFESLNTIIVKRNEIINNQLDVVGPEMATTLEDIKLSLLSEQDTLGPNQQASNRTSVTIVAVVTIIALIAGVFISVIITRLILTPVCRAVKLAEDLEHGRFDTKIETHNNDEIGMLMKSLMKMADSIAGVINNIEGASNQISESADKVAVATEQTSQGADEQLLAIGKVVDAMGLMASSVENVAESANEAADSANEADKQSEHGYTVIKQAIERIEALAQAMNNSVDEINTLKTQSQNIGSILDVIHNIADQTNLLALNAAIEAARAGEQGRGFSVVADEVRTLAKKTQDSIAQIEVLINELQNGTEQAVVSISQGQSQVSETVASAVSAGDAIESIREAIKAITGLNNQIAKASSEQSEVASGINVNVGNVSLISKNSASVSTETARSSNELTQVSQNLRSIVAQFKSA